MSVPRGESIALITFLMSKKKSDSRFFAIPLGRNVTFGKMGKVPELSLALRGQIVGMRKNNATMTQIADAFQVSVSTVWRTLNRVSTTSQFESRQRPGRPKIVDERMVHKIKRLVTTDPFISSAKVVADLRQSGLLTPCALRVRQILQTTLSLPSRRPAKKPQLTQVQRLKRLDFCRRVKDWTVEDWSRVLWSGESTFEQFGVRKRHVRRPDPKNLDDLIRLIKLYWCRKLSVQLCPNLVALMPERIRYVLSHTGESCPY